MKFWLAEGAIQKEEDALKRAEDLVAVCKLNDEIVGVATGIKTVYPPLHNHFVVYRTYVGKEHRQKGIARQIFHNTYDSFNQNDNQEVIGFLCALENASLNENTKAVWAKDRNLNFMGFDNRGIQIRVAFFENAEVKMPVKK